MTYSTYGQFGVLSDTQAVPTDSGGMRPYQGECQTQIAATSLVIHFQICIPYPRRFRLGEVCAIDTE